MSKYDYDFTVIGGGSGGYAAARTAAALGLRTAVVEGGERIGGLCILRGCMPTKALLYAAEVNHLVQHAKTWGIKVPDSHADYAAIKSRKDSLIKEFADFREEQLRDGRFEFIHAHASFMDPNTVNLSSGGQLTSKHFVIATGSKVSPVPLKALETIGVITSDDALAADALPESIIVLGGGAIAIEFAQFYQRMGVKTTIIQRSSHLLKEMDTDVSEETRNALESEGLTIYTGTQLLDAKKEGATKTVVFQQGDDLIEVSAEAILHALGRSPATDTLNLTAAGVETNRGRIVTNNQMRSLTAPHIFAAGDCTGPHDVVHIAIQQGEIAAYNATSPKKPKEIQYDQTMSIVFSDPQVAVVGMTEAQAHAQGIPVHTASYPFNDHGKSMIMDAQHGFVKLIAEKGSGKLLGGACVGPVGGELIHEVAVAIAAKMTASQFARVPHYHPTLAEIWTYPAEDIVDEMDS